MNAWIRAARIFVSGKRSMTLVWLNGRFELPGQRVAVADDGTFALPGLAPVQYRLRVVELSGSRFVPSGWDDPAMDEEGPDERIVRAPSHGIVLEYAWTSTRLELGGDVDRAAEGRLVLETKALYRGNDRTHIPEYWSASFSLAGRDRTVVFQTPAQNKCAGRSPSPIASR